MNGMTIAENKTLNLMGEINKKLDHVIELLEALVDKGQAAPSFYAIADNTTWTGRELDTSDPGVVSNLLEIERDR